MRIASLLASMLLSIAQAAAQEIPPPDPIPSRDGGDAATVLTTSSLQSSSDLTADDVNAWLDGYMPYALKTGDIAGAVVVVVKGGEILTQRGYGYSDVAERKPVDPATTLFRPGSVAKLFTWTAVMQLVEQGKIDLDADVNIYLDFKIPERDGKPISMRNLLQHTPGFEDQSKDIMASDGDAVPSYEEILKRWTPARIFPPGVTPAYSNYGASLAGYIVERVSGEAFDDYLDRHIFAPLAMEHSTFRQPLPAALEALMSKGYDVASNEPKGFEFVGPAPAGSLSSTGEDMARFMIAHLQKGEYDGNRILEGATAEEMHDSPLTILPPLNRMQLGFFETNVNGRKVIAHLGDTQWFHSSLHLFIEENVGFFVSFNSLGKGAAAGGLRGALFTDFAERYFPALQSDDNSGARIDAETSAEHARLMAGNWIVSRRSATNFMSAAAFLGQMKISVGPEGSLKIPLPGLNGQPQEWVETAPFVWREVGGHERLAAKVEDGEVVRWSIDGVSPFMVFDRAPWYANGALLLPMFGVAIAVLAISVVLWPVGAIVRWRYRAASGLDARARRARRISRIAAIAILGAIAGWVMLFVMISTDLSHLSASTDLLLRALQILGAVAFIGGFLLTSWNLFVVWSKRPGWFARLWSVVLFASAAAILWVAFVAKFISFGVNY